MKKKIKIVNCENRVKTDLVARATVRGTAQQRGLSVGSYTKGLNLQLSCGQQTVFQYATKKLLNCGVDLTVAKHTGSTWRSHIAQSLICDIQ